MNKTSLLLQKWVLVLSVIFPLANDTQLQAQSSRSANNNLKTSQVRFTQPTLTRQPENRGAPRDRRGAGTRSECPAVKNKPELIGLVPLMQINSKQNLAETKNTITSLVVLGLTVSEYPTFWFYLPYSSKQINSALFIILDESNNSVTSEPLAITISSTPGIISVSMPSKEKPLLIGKYYHWYFVISCDSQGSSEDIAVEGLVQRIDLDVDFQHRLKSATPKQRVALYAQAGIWQDAVTVLAELRRNKPQDTALMSDWHDLLQSVDLETIINEPITSCCTLIEEK